MKKAAVKLEIDCERTTNLITEFIRTRVHVAGVNGVVVGISGGIDSTVITYLCVKALGPEKVLGVLLPESSTSSSDVNDAEDVAKILGIRSNKIYIDPLVKNVCQLLPDHIKTKSKLVIGNVKARLRMVILYALANDTRSLVIGTGNKTEIMVGYTTKFGDGACDINPIGDLYKTQVRQLAKYLGIPDDIVTKEPSAGFWPGQTDEGDLGITYDILDLILNGIERWDNVSEICRNTGIPKKEVLRVTHLIRHSEHKRQPPVVLKLSYRTSGIDWLLPQTKGKSTD